MKSKTIKDTEIFYTQHDLENSNETIIWGHGWGQNHHAFTGLIESLKSSSNHIALDFPGFGKSPKPDQDWDTKDYADSIAQFLQSLDLEKIIWIGHSFGGRVGVQLAAHYPELIDKLILISGAGLKKKHGPLGKAYYQARIYLYKILKTIAFTERQRLWLRSKFSSSDANNAGQLYEILKKTVSEDLTETSKTITCPTLLIYGEHDTATPADFGERYHKLIPNSQLHILPDHDHYSVLSTGRYVVAKFIKHFIKK